MEELIQFDKQLLLWFNGSDSLFLDSLIMTLTNAKTWIPLYLGLFYAVCRTNWMRRMGNPNQQRAIMNIVLVLLAAGLCVLLAGAVDDEIVKPLVARWRPTHDPQIGALVDTVNDYRGGNYGFFSAHAANTFSIAVFFSLLMRWRFFTVCMVGWSLVNCYTRLYLGVHYPGDITVGLLWGGFVGWLVYRIYCRAYSRVNGPLEVPRLYDRKLLLVPIAVLALTIVYAFLHAAIQHLTTF